MHEYELKLEIPAARLDAVRAAMAALQPRPLRLRAVYLDTADQALARGGVAVRLRLEGDRWVQTAKGPGSGPVERLEHNAPVDAPADGPAPAADLGRHDATPVGERLRAALGVAPGDPWPALVPVFETDVQRTLCDVREGGSTLEVALDEGRILAGGREAAVRELEVELLAGDAQDAIAVARRWAAGHGLWLSTISKAQRGRRLADGDPAPPAVHAQPPATGERPRAGELLSAVLASCLAQVLGNASELAAGSGGDGQVHQLRVGIRRLRTALRELQVLHPLDLAAEPALVAAFRALGEHRDRLHVTATVGPRIEAAGGLPVDFGDGGAAPDPGEVVRAPAFQDALFALLAQQVLVQQDGGGKVRKRIAGALDRLWRQVTRDGSRFTRLEEAQQHRVRKRLKRLRYLAEFAAPLYPARKVARFVDALKPVQDALGAYNDELVAAQLWARQAQHDAAARFGADWLAGRQPAQARACRRELRRLGRQGRPFWD